MLLNFKIKIKKKKKMLNRVSFESFTIPFRFNSIADWIRRKFAKITIFSIEIYLIIH